MIPLRLRYYEIFVRLREAITDMNTDLVLLICRSPVWVLLKLEILDALLMSNMLTFVSLAMVLFPRVQLLDPHSPPDQHQHRHLRT